ncbi:CPBP family intramembrane glutamic endopeptidase [Gorillibacterium timonense]|uniref:CPBP family intramembrane glutamic endopeptidase n=1 Tax=Gorillibacterium timonense TaxID=1689269 RepID=UPI00071C411D|nr:CPBP family intramembrane glutamic endopeptidase [Gorillibacterium timonense]
MKKWDFRNIKFKYVSIDDLDDRLLLLNLYITQLLTFLVGFLLTSVQRNFIWTLFPLKLPTMVLWGVGLAVAVVIADMVVSRFVNEDISDDGGINEMLFAKRPLWHIALICLIVAFCEEILFRGAIQHWLGPYWTSILFAAIHVRYLQHWLMTGLVFSISYGLGWVYVHTGTLWTPVIAHFLIDFIMGCLIRYHAKDSDE